MAFAQSGSIEGTIADQSGAVLPGVAVEAASPALIEQSRGTVTDGQGRYRLIDLRPGSYTLTFTLQGFQVTKRENIVLTTGFTATVNATLQIGAVGETVTVTSESPIVDTVNTRVQTVVNQALIEALRRALDAFRDAARWRALQVAGMRQDHSWDRSAREYVKIYERALVKMA